MLDIITKIMTTLLGVMLLGIGVRWLVDPAGAAPLVGMELLGGVAGSSQVGDLGSFFLVAGAFALLGLITRNATLLYTPAALVGVAAVYRTVASMAHDVAFAPDLIVLEVVMCVIFLLAGKRLAATSN
jgi:hypothetical protein